MPSPDQKFRFSNPTSLNLEILYLFIAYQDPIAMGQLQDQILLIVTELLLIAGS